MDRISWEQVMKSKGFSLIEVVIAMSLMAITITAILQGLSVGLGSSDRARDKATMMLLAQSQLENILKQSYDPVPANYSLVSSIPAGYNVNVAVSVPISYTYSNGSAATETVQFITVSVSGGYSSVTLSGYKARQ